MDTHLLNFDTLINLYLVPFGLKVVAAIAIWIIGGMLVNALSKLVRRLLTARQFEKTLINYATSAIQVILRIMLVMGILEVCGIPTTSFAAMIGAVGVALGVAWSGLLANFAAGIFLVVLRPFKLGDYITAAGQTGTVSDIGLVTTIITTDNNLRVIVGNNKLFADNIINYNVNPTRRTDLRCQIAYGVDPQEAIAKLLARVKAIPNVLENPAPAVAIQEFNATGTLLALRVHAATPNFGQVYNDVNSAIAEVCLNEGWPAPATYQVAVPVAQPPQN
ncbi:mechanosensitive ion channel family protein [Herbaspirillum sp. YR522]|uniref:mechanosensitive ion channel family protein n=1 Tax=Herbaspirillum sp. YR522 TaxID=1144342 RepID=UPI00026F5CD6|nr:mechanosensitive ion channel family protein [Herbaspirillum sp. YR522]EJN01771.1 small-conductance mechanosensitive channel [Herbaspirillum sp. YR522]